MSHDVFISYSSHDKSVADAICAKLEADRIRCWIAPRNVSPGIPYAEALIDGIKGAKTFVLVLSSHSNVSQHVLREVERAVNMALPIIPFRIEEVALSKAMEYFVSTPHWLDALTPPLEMHIQKLSKTVKVLLSVGSESGDTVSTGKQQERDFSTWDEEILRELYVCFDRPAFRVTFEHETDLEALMAALDDTIAAINTGVKKRRDGVVFGQAVKGKSYFENALLRESFDKIVMLLTEAKSVYVKAVRAGYFFDLNAYKVFSLEDPQERLHSAESGRFPHHENADDTPRGGRRIGFHRDHQVEANAVAVKIDKLRNEVLEIANGIYERLGMRSFPRIVTPD